MEGSACYAGYDSYLSHNFGGTEANPSPGIAAVKHLLQNGTVSTCTGTNGTDQTTGARFRHYTYRAFVTLLDKCASRCKDLACQEPPACAVNEQLCNSLSGTCDTSCCDKQDGETCVLRGRPSTCKDGKCTGASAVCGNACTECLPSTRTFIVATAVTAANACARALCAARAPLRASLPECCTYIICQ
jgi:hypothetical protein